jgi:hypothetical protein
VYKVGPNPDLAQAVPLNQPLVGKEAMGASNLFIYIENPQRAKR